MFNRMDARKDATIHNITALWVKAEDAPLSAHFAAANRRNVENRRVTDAFAEGNW